MSQYYAKNGERYIPVYESPGRTKQSFKDQCDVNKIIKRAAQAGGLSHVQKYDKAVYGEFDGEFDLLTASVRIKKAEAIFNELPAEVRKEFNHNALDFVAFAGHPDNADKLEELIPAIAEPGAYFANPVKRFGQGAGLATPPSQTPAAASSPATASPPPSEGDSAPSGASDA